MQKDKLRPIDNFKESMLSLTFGCYGKIELKAIFSSGVADNALRLGPYMRRSRLK